jgi:hypothetical protein
MEPILVIVTLVSLALAMAMGVITWRLLQEERQRADARVAVLEQGLAESFHTTTPPATPAPASVFARRATAPLDAPSYSPDSRGSSPEIVTVSDDTDWLAEFPSATFHPATQEATLNGVSSDTARFTLPLQAARASDTSELRTTFDEADAAGAATTVDTRGDLFGQTVANEAEAGGMSRRLVAVAAVAAVMICAVLAVWTIGRVMAPAADPKAAAAVAPAALELVALHHTQDSSAGTITINGLVRNPVAGAEQDRLTAVVFFFDSQGNFLSSTRAPLDFRALAPGEESPFQLSASVPAGVARYRVSFRRDEGAIVPHVDRRPQEVS